MGQKYGGRSPIDAMPAMARHFERRPEQVFDMLVPEVIDASILPKRKVEGLWLFRINQLFADSNQVFIGVGLPNCYLDVPDGQGSYQKLSVKSLRRAPTTIDDTHDLAQAGVQFWLRNLPDSAQVRLRECMQQVVGEYFDTCMIGVGTVMTNAGFTSGGQPLNQHKLPGDFLRAALRDGLEFEGRKIDWKVIRTSGTPATERFIMSVKRAELATFRRHARKHLEASARKNALARAGLWLMNLPGTIVNAIRGNRERKKEQRDVAPGLPYGGEYKKAMLHVSMPSRVGMLLRLFWGPHALFRVAPQGINIDAFLNENKEAFPVVKDWITWAKKRVLFSERPVKLLSSLLCPTFVPAGELDESDFLDGMRTHTEEHPNKYNMVVVGSWFDWTITIARINVGWKWVNKIVDWILAKHVFLTKWSKYVRFCGEVWKDIDGTIWVSRNSGTYQPSEDELDAMVALLQAAMPHCRVRKANLDGSPADTPAAAHA